ASATNRLHSEPNLTERLYEEEKRRTNALLFRFFSKLLDQIPSLSPKPPTEDNGCNHSRELANDEGRYSGGRYPPKGAGKRPRNGNSRVSERSRSREPIGRRDVEADGIRNRIRPLRDAAEDSQDQAEGRDSFRQPLSQTCALGDRELPYRQLKHEVRHPHAHEAAEHLRY